MRKKAAVLLLFCVLLAGCSKEQTAKETAGSASSDIFAMDTIISITAYGENAKEAIAAAETEIYRLDELLSIGKETSEISILNKNGGGTLSEDTAYIVKQALSLYYQTEGAFDITILPLMEAWGFTTGEYQVPDQARLDALLNLIGSDKLNLQGNVLTYGVAGMAIDLGGIAKGYASSRLMDIFREYGVESALVSLGGNVQTLGTKTDGSMWRIGVQDPVNTGANIGVISMADKAAITSGGYERYFEQDGVLYHHILDPSTGKPAENGLSSVTIVSSDGTLADGLSTALFVMGAEKAVQFWQSNHNDFDAVLVTSDGKILITAGLDGCFSSDQEYEVIQP